MILLVFLLLHMPAIAMGRPGSQLGRKPVMGWNTWCTTVSCGVDWCSSPEILAVANALKISGLQSLGYDHINCECVLMIYLAPSIFIFLNFARQITLVFYARATFYARAARTCAVDDCWGVRDKATGKIEGDPARFPEGMKQFIAKIHAMGFRFGLYTDWGVRACHSPFVGSWGHYAADAETFADWQVQP